MAAYTTFRLERDDRGVATLTLDRPEVRNAFDATMIAELTQAAGELAVDDDVRVVVLAAAGEKVFSAGADLNWMGSMKDWTYEENVADARRMDAMFRALWDLPKPLIGRINGHALGGGTGLTAVCDIAIAVDRATFGFTEVLLGIAPAVISPYAVRKVGRSFARAVFATGERFDAQRALSAGLVHQVVTPDALDAAVADAVDRCLLAAPQAAGVAKGLVDLALRPLDEAAAETVEVIARLRVAEEGQEGISAFLGKRPAAWVPAEGS
jgi:methylglutaconyl-CoA hydratase